MSAINILHPILAFIKS